MKSDIDAMMRANNIDALLVVGPGDHNPGMVYLTGGDPPKGAATAVVRAIEIYLPLGDLINLRELQVTAEDARLNVTVRYALRRTGNETTETFVRSTA